jgi:putative tricarboxylic transport membrane protein
MRSRLEKGEALVAVGIILLGLVMVSGTLAIPGGGGYERIGPTAFPWVISLALVVIGSFLLRQALHGPIVQERAGPVAFGAGPFAGVSLGLILHLILIERAGFVIASTALFSCTAQALGARHWLVTGAIAVALSVAVYFAFSSGLDLTLPTGTLFEGR